MSLMNEKHARMKPYSLRGLGPRIVEMYEVEGLRFEAIAVQLGGYSERGIRLAYMREKRKAPTGDTEGARTTTEGGTKVNETSLPPSTTNEEKK